MLGCVMLPQKRPFYFSIDESITNESKVLGLPNTPTNITFSLIVYSPNKMTHHSNISPDYINRVLLIV